MPTGSVHCCNIVNNGQPAFYARATDPGLVVDATNNWWGVADPDSIEQMVFHKIDNATYPVVDFIPFASDPFDFNFWTDAEDSERPRGVLPDDPVLFQNFPNPFNSATRIDFHLPRRSHVSITVFNILGRCVKSVLDGYMPAGDHSVSWDGTDSDNRPVSSGVYLYRLTSDSRSHTSKMLLLR